MFHLEPVVEDKFSPVIKASTLLDDGVTDKKAKCERVNSRRLSVEQTLSDSSDNVSASSPSGGMSKVPSAMSRSDQVQKSIENSAVSTRSASAVIGTPQHHVAPILSALDENKNMTMGKLYSCSPVCIS